MDVTPRLLTGTQTLWTSSDPEAAPEEPAHAQGTAAPTAGVPVTAAVPEPNPST